MSRVERNERSGVEQLRAKSRKLVSTAGTRRPVHKGAVDGDERLMSCPGIVLGAPMFSRRGRSRVAADSSRRWQGPRLGGHYRAARIVGRSRYQIGRF